MYIRFVIHQKDEDSGRRKGLFQVSAELRESGGLTEYEEEQLLEIRDWFDANMEAPSSFSRSKKYHSKNVAITCFGVKLLQLAAR